MAGKAVQSGKTGQTGKAGTGVRRRADGIPEKRQKTMRREQGGKAVHGEEYRPLRKGNIGAAMPALGCRSCVGRAHAGDVQAAQLFK